MLVVHDLGVLLKFCISQGILVKCYTCRFVAAADGGGEYLLSGEASLPGCTYAACVALVLSAQSVGLSRVYAAPQNSDVAGSIAALRSLGIKISDASGCITVEGAGVGGFAAAKHDVCVENSPYVACLMLGALVTCSFTSFIFNKNNDVQDIRDQSPFRADINELMEIFSTTGAKFLHNDLFPLVITGVEDIAPLAERRIISSHFVKSSLLLACVNIAGHSCLHARGELPAYTEWLLKHYGADVRVSARCEVDEIVICGQKELLANDVQIFPSRARVLAAVSVVLLSPGASVVIPSVLVDRGMKTVLDILVRMGGCISISESSSGLHRLEVTASELFGVEITSVELRLILEELPVLCVIFAFSEGITRIFGVSELPSGLKRSIEIVIRGLAQCGITATMAPDLLEIQGCADAVRGEVELDAASDERSAIAFLILSLISGVPIRICRLNQGVAADFVQTLNSLNKGKGAFSLEGI